MALVFGMALFGCAATEDVPASPEPDAGTGAAGTNGGTGGPTGAGGRGAPAGLGGTGGFAGKVGGVAGAGGSAAPTGASGAAGGRGGNGSSGSSGSAGGPSGAAGAGPTGAGGATSCAGGTSRSGDLVVDLGSVQQKISGFGASTAWGSTMSDADADLLFSTTSGAGLSLHRIRIAPGGTTTETAIAQKAQARGATVWATPWTPPAGDKSNNNIAGGTLTNGQAFASTLTSFVATMKASGVNIFAVSAQNEPDAKVTYESCGYTGATLASFIATSMGPAFAGSGVKIISPETQNWCTFKGYADAIFSNATAANYTSIIATHEYGCSPFAYPAAQSAGKEFWETEVYDQTTTAGDPGIGSGLVVAKLISDALTIANMNAWHYWWVYPSGAGNGALWDFGTGKATKRLYVMGNFSKFVRPGYERVGVTGTMPSGVSVSGFKSSTDGTVVVVAINSSASTANLSVFISGGTACSVTPWVTSSTDSLVAKAAVPVAGSRFTFTLGGQSVTSFVGKP
jgi:glucuronoarabinoxylan endo-1,4-beta-xylanase